MKFNRARFFFVNFNNHREKAVCVRGKVLLNLKTLQGFILSSRTERRVSRKQVVSLIRRPTTSHLTSTGQDGSFSPHFSPFLSLSLSFSICLSLLMCMPLTCHQFHMAHMTLHIMQQDIMCTIAITIHLKATLVTHKPLSCIVLKGVLYPEAPCARD